MNILLFDTDVLIDLLRGNQETLDQVNEFQQGFAHYCSVITVAEIYAGMFPKEKKCTDVLLDSLVHIPVNEEIAKLAGNLRNKHKRIELMDCLIAASAMYLDATLLTKNGKHYPMNDLLLKVLR